MSIPRNERQARQAGRRPISIRDLASHLDVSIGTVSRALNGRSDVNAETRQRILDAARELGYSPNQSGRSLRKGTTGMVAAMIPTTEAMPLVDPFFMTVLEGTRQRLSESSLDLVALLCGPEETADAYLRRAVERRLADAILIAETQREDLRIAYLLERRIPFVAFGRSQSAGSYSWVDLDFEGVAERSVERLHSLGHRRIAVATKDSEINYGFVFVDAYRAALERHGLPFDESIVFRGGGNSDGGYRVGESLLAVPERPTALVLVDEKMSVGLYRKLSEAGLVPGRDLSIIAFQEGPSGRYLSPKLTCFRANLRDLGSRLGDALLASIRNPQHGRAAEPVRAIWPMELVLGESDGPPLA